MYGKRALLARFRREVLNWKVKLRRAAIKQIKCYRLSLFTSVKPIYSRVKIYLLTWKTVVRRIFDAFSYKTSLSSTPLVYIFDPLALIHIDLARPIQTYRISNDLLSCNLHNGIRKFVLTVSAHPYCARKRALHIMHENTQ